MLRHLQSSDLQTVLVIGAFILTSAVFFFFFVRALRMKKDKADYMSQLPLQNDTETPADHE